MGGSYKLVLSLALCSALTSHAMAATGNALSSTIGNLRYTVIDLTADGGNVPSYTLSAESAGGYGSLYNWEQGYNVSSRLTVLPGRATANHLQRGPFTVSQTTNGTAGDINASVGWNRNVPFPAGSTQVTTWFSYHSEITVSAGTALVISGHVAQYFDGADSNSQDRVESAFSAWLNDFQTGSSSSIYRRHLSSVDAPLANWNDSSNFAVTLTNNTSAELSFVFNMDQRLSWSMNAPLDANPTDPGPVNPVPEPSTYAMLGAGLALLGGLARRRNRRAT